MKPNHATPDVPVSDHGDLNCTLDCSDGVKVRWPSPPTASCGVGGGPASMDCNESDPRFLEGPTEGDRLGDHLVVGVGALGVHVI